MEPLHIRFGGGSADTLLHPVVAAGVAIAIILICCLPRKHIVIPLLLALIMIPSGQVLLLAGVHFTVPRIVVLAGLARWGASRKSASQQARASKSIDRLFVAFALFSFVIFSLQWLDTQALVRSVGELLDRLGGFLALRFAIQDQKDVRRAIQVFALLTLSLGACMLNEQLSGTNIFALLGGLPPMAVRNGGIRSQGPFEVYITAGVFGATGLPLFVWLWSEAKGKIYSVLGGIGASTMMACSYSSTPPLAYVAGIVSLCFWPLRRRLRLIRWALVLMLTALHLVMKAPAWALISRIDLTGSSSGYHRYMLIDNFIRHFGDWWLLGTKEYDKWGLDMWDLSNQYVAYGLTGGVITLVAFLALICKSFAALGTARHRVHGDRRQQWLLWCLGAALVAHVAAYFGIGYFDQVQFAWYALLAMICAALSDIKTRAGDRFPPEPASSYACDPGTSWTMQEISQ